MGFGPGLLDPRVARALDLTEAERQEIRGIAESHRDEMKVLAERAQPIRQQLQDAVLAGNSAAIDLLAPDLGQLQVDEAKLRARVHAEIFAKLTPEQQEKMKTLQEQMRTRRQDAQAGPLRGRR